MAWGGKGGHSMAPEEPAKESITQKQPQCMLSPINLVYRPNLVRSY